MFGFIKKMFIELLNFSGTLASMTTVFKLTTGIS